MARLRLAAAFGRHHEPGVKIRKALDREYPALSALALRSKAHWGHSPDFLNACQAELSVDGARGPDEPVYLARGALGVLGFYSLERLDVSRWELGHLFVEPDAIGRG